VSVAQYVVTGAGLAAIVWVLWYFLLSRGPVARPTRGEDGGCRK